MRWWTSAFALEVLIPQQARYDQPRTEQFYRDVRERLMAVGSIESVSWAANQPLWAKLYRRVSLEGQVQQHGTSSILTLMNIVDAGYFRTLGVPLRQGRDFALQDRADSRAVAIINDTMAAKYWPGQDPIGRHIQFDGEPAAREIVGVVTGTRDGIAAVRTERQRRCSCDRGVPDARSRVRACLLPACAPGEPHRSGGLVA